jgi:hypothetical protein
MRITIDIKNNHYCPETLQGWFQIWSQVCRMAYNKENIVESIIAEPGIVSIDGLVLLNQTEEFHSKVYKKRVPINDEHITLDYVWSIYSKKYKYVHIVPEFKELHVPKELFENLGVKQWFNYSFPNCKVTYWKR